MFHLKTKKWGEVEVAFVHVNRNRINEKHVSPPDNGATVCNIKQGEKDILARGITHVSLQDQYNKEIGRKISLARALKDLGATRLERYEFWKKYFQTQEDARKEARITQFFNPEN